MFDRDHYVPILKGRKGEYDALETLIPSMHQRLTPLVEIPPIPWDYATETPAKTIDQHLKRIGPKINRAWGRRGRLFADLLWISERERMTDGSHPLTHMFQSLRTHNIQSVPVVSLLQGDEYMQACRAIVGLDDRGVCVRIQREDFAEFSDLSGAVGRILNTLGAKVENADLILDLRALTPDRRSLGVDEVINLVNLLPRLREWRTFTIAATSFPQNLTGLPPSDATFVPRREWTLWTDLSQRRNQVPRIPTFGDYAISHPEPAEVDPRVMRPSASIRYTCDAAWLIPKARNLKDHGYRQFHEVCRALVQRAEYRGRRFSWGDQYIDDCAAERVGTGNLTTWRQVGTSHHLAFVVHQLANGVGS
jgi:Beta protein